MNRGYENFPIGSAGDIRLLVLDVDGVLTNGRIILTDGNEQLKGFDVRDGHGLKLLQRADIKIAILTGRTSKVVEHRARELGIEYVVQGSKNKSEGLDEILAKVSVSENVCAYMGDDIVDLPAMRRCRLGLAPADAHPAVLEKAQWISDFAGGRGAARQACEGLILASGTWQQVMTEPYGVSPADCGWPS